MRSTKQNRCIVPGCTREGRNKLGVRCRVSHSGAAPVAGKAKSYALWSPDADAFLCDQHAMGGAHVTILFEPDNSKQTTVKVIAAAHAEERTKPIKQP
jgi:hypothetical protein